MTSDSQKITTKLRVDKWLWAARFFKTRSLAAEAIAKNRIKVDGQRIKPSRTLQPGVVLHIEKPPYVFEVTVLQLNDKRRPASEAQLMYCESEQSIANREQQAANRRMEYHVHAGLAGAGRPSKKQRRQIIRFQNTHDAPSEADDDYNNQQTESMQQPSSSDFVNYDDKNKNE